MKTIEQHMLYLRDLTRKDMLVLEEITAGTLLGLESTIFSEQDLEKVKLHQKELTIRLRGESIESAKKEILIEKVEQASLEIQGFILISKGQAQISLFELNCLSPTKRRELQILLARKVNAELIQTHYLPEDAPQVRLLIRLDFLIKSAQEEKKNFYIAGLESVCQGTYFSSEAFEFVPLEFKEFVAVSLGKQIKKVLLSPDDTLKLNSFIQQANLKLQERIRLETEKGLYYDFGLSLIKLGFLEMTLELFISLSLEEQNKFAEYLTKKFMGTQTFAEQEIMKSLIEKAQNKLAQREERILAERAHRILSESEPSTLSAVVEDIPPEPEREVIVISEEAEENMLRPEHEEDVLRSEYGGSTLHSEHEERADYPEHGGSMFHSEHEERARYPEHVGSRLHSEHEERARYPEHGGSMFHSEHEERTCYPEHGGSTLHSEHEERARYPEHGGILPPTEDEESKRRIEEIKTAVLTDNKNACFEYAEHIDWFLRLPGKEKEHFEFLIENNSRANNTISDQHLENYLDKDLSEEEFTERFELILAKAKGSLGTKISSTPSYLERYLQESGSSPCNIQRRQKVLNSSFMRMLERKHWERLEKQHWAQLWATPLKKIPIEAIGFISEPSARGLYDILQGRLGAKTIQNSRQNSQLRKIVIEIERKIGILPENSILKTSSSAAPQAAASHSFPSGTLNSPFLHFQSPRAPNSLAESSTASPPSKRQRTG